MPVAQLPNNRIVTGGERSTPIDAMLGELGEKRVEYELDRKVER